MFDVAEKGTLTMMADPLLAVATLITRSELEADVADVIVAVWRERPTAGDPPVVACSHTAL